MTDERQTIVALDLEGVLVPEIWIAVAERTGINALSRTTRDEPDYDVLMRGRLELLASHDLTLTQITDVIARTRHRSTVPPTSSTDFAMSPRW